jgi:hypothetical protein
MTDEEWIALAERYEKALAEVGLWARRCGEQEAHRMGAESFARTAEARIAKLEAALWSLVKAKAIADVRGIVAGWNGENRIEGPYQERHPYRLGVTLKTCAGHVYELDDALDHARAALEDKP